MILLILLLVYGSGCWFVAGLVVGVNTTTDIPRERFSPDEALAFVVLWPIPFAVFVVMSVRDRLS